MALKEYEINGYTFKLTEAEAKRRGATLVEPKAKGKKPQNKSKAPANKAKAPKGKAKPAPEVEAEAQGEELKDILGSTE